MEEGHSSPRKVPLSYRQRMEVDFRLASEKPDSVKAYALCILLGMFGAHRFYLGERRTAIIMLVLGLTVIGLPVSLLWAVVDLFRIPGMIRERTAQLRERLLAEAVAEAAG